MNKSAAEADIVEDFGPYKLVVRLVGGKHLGVLWRSGKKLIEVRATSNVAAQALVKTRYYEMRRAEVGELGTSIPSDENKMAQALMYVWPHLKSAQTRMLQAQYRAPQRSMSTVELAEVAGYKGHHAVNLFYGQAGLMLFHEAPRLLPLGKNGEPVYSFTLSTEGEKPEEHESKAFIWEMRPEVARGLELAGLVSH
jgi:hypothetical protein